MVQAVTADYRERKQGPLLAAALFTFLSTCAWAESRGVVADILLTQTTPISPIANDRPVEQHTAGEFAQDVQGRTRVEWDDVITITDPVDGVAWHVDVAKGVAFRSELEPARPARPAGANRPTGEPLEPRVINGLQCEGLRWTHEIPTATKGIVTETWTTHAFGMPLEVLTVTRDPHNGVHTQELRNIREAEFPNNTFRPNPRFRIVEDRK